MDEAAKAVQEMIMNGIDLIREGAGIDITAITFITQICATVVLFLFVRFFAWGMVTNILETRKAKTQAILDERDEAQKEVNELNLQAKTILSNAELTAKQHLDETIKAANLQKEKIIKEAKEEATQMLIDAKNQIEFEKAQVADDIKNEIIDVAYLLSEKITANNIDRSKNQEIVDNFFKEVAND